MVGETRAQYADTGGRWLAATVATREGWCRWARAARAFACRGRSLSDVLLEYCSCMAVTNSFD